MDDATREDAMGPQPSLLKHAHIGPIIPASAGVTRYCVAVGVVVLIAALRAALAPLLGEQAPLLPFVLGVLLSAYLAGRGPALLASALTPVLATLWFTSWPMDAPPWQWPLHVVFFLVLAVLTTLLMHGMQVTVNAAAENARRTERSARALREANQRKDEFLAMLAHELRNPLTPVRNLAHILGRGMPDAGTVRRAARMLERQANHLTHLVDDLLDVARITHRRIQLKREIVNAEEFVTMALETVQPTLSARRQVVTLSPPSSEAYVEGDVVRLSQIVTNLLTNASKYSPEGARIQAAISADVGEVQVAVSDPGAGIDPQLLPHVFDLFLQGDRSLDRAQGGLGIGLTIVKHLAEMHGGGVEASSLGLGKGSEFRLRLPRAARPIKDPAASPPPRARVRRRRVLVVDDSNDCAESLRDVLRLDGHTAVVVNDGPAALSMLDEFPADVVLLDVGLPRMDGYMVAHAIRARYAPGKPRPRIVALTGYGREEDRQSALRSGFDEHLTKPVEPERLLQVLTEGQRSFPVREDSD
jgi:signal transduction histidine kinase/ActR/RegA family two-component response regulator